VHIPQPVACTTATEVNLHGAALGATQQNGRCRCATVYDAAIQP